MKTTSLIMTVATAFLTAAIPVSAAIVNTMNPTSVYVKIYEVWASEGADCTNMVRFFSSSSPQLTDMANGPALGSGNLPNGTYRCFALKMNDTIRPTASETSGSCVAGQQLAQDVARGDPGYETSTSPTGETIALSAASEDPYFYFAVGGNTANNGMRPDAPMEMAAPITVTGDRDITFVFNFDGKVGTNVGGGPGGTDYCECDAPLMSVR